MKITHNEIFEQYVDESVPSVDFDTEWANGTGYLDFATSYVTDKMVQFKDNYGRRGVILPVDGKSSVVIFQRNPNSNIWVYNAPRGFTQTAYLVLGKGNLSVDRLECVLSAERWNGGVFTSIVRECTFEYRAKEEREKRMLQQ